jgi:hypothetical protein
MRSPDEITHEIYFLLIEKSICDRRNISSFRVFMSIFVSRHRWSPQITMKVDKVGSFQPALRPSVFLFSWWRLQCHLKATHFIHFHCDLRTPAMSTDRSQVLVNIFFILNNLIIVGWEQIFFHGDFLSQADVIVKLCFLDG